MKRLLVFLAMLFFVSPLAAFAQANSGAEERGMEYLLFMDMPAVGTLTQADASKSPVAVTVIDKEMLKLTPARNLYDVLEVYVPGFQYTTHFDSSHMGMRGLMVDRDYNYLLLVNGRMINQKSHNGPITELENWDLNDIEKVEVMRGPGSVTYGPGAIAGVISITTKNAATSPGTKAGFQYVSNYNSTGGYFSEGIKRANYSLYGYASITRTLGEENPRIFAYSSPAREAGYAGTYMGKNVYMQNPTVKPYADYLDIPQMKLYGEVNFFEDWKFWARYVNSGTTRMTTWLDNPPSGDAWFRQSRNLDGHLVNNPSTMARQFTSALENIAKISDTLSLNTMLSFSTVDHERTDIGLHQKGNFVENYAETGVAFKSILKYDSQDKLKAAVGFEYNYDRLGLGWFDKDKDAFIIDDGVLFLSSKTSPAYAARSWISSNQVIALTSTDMYSYAFLGEVSYELTNKLSVMLSARLDDGQLYSYAISPRISFIYDAGDVGLFKLSLQESIRENTLVQLAAARNFQQLPPNPEKYKGFEIIYDKNFGNFSNEISIFYGKDNLLGWNAAGGGSGVNETPSTSPDGKLHVGGIEVSTKYTSDNKKLVVGFNHAWIRQFHFKLGEHKDSSYVSMVDSYNTNQSGVTVYGIGTDRMNWANNTTKLYSIYKLTDKLSVFNSFRINWGYAGNKKWMEMFEAGTRGTSMAGLTEENVNFMKKNHIFDTDVRFDMSLSYQLREELRLTIFGQNLIKFTKNWRYSYIQEGGVAVKEPTVFGVRADCSF
jgi:outer membrane receptor protein involved in Fe transport